MKIENIGEFGLINMVKNSITIRNSKLLIGIGDDCAVYQPSEGWVQLATTDMLVEGIHFKREWTTANELGYKAAAVNISDIAAMGGLPKYILVSLALPQGLAADFVMQFYSGLEEICSAFNISIIGGDTVKSMCGIIINITLIGEVEEGLYVPRSGARIGDIIAVTNCLGESAAGLDILRSGLQHEQVFKKLIKSHNCPVPQVELGRILMRYNASSMNDISDGLASELNEIASASKVGMLIYEDRLPVSKDLTIAADRFDKKATDYALYGGEDYQLVFTMAAEDLLRVINEHSELSLTPIGEVKDNQFGVRIVDINGNESELAMRGYNHFRRED